MTYITGITHDPSRLHHSQDRRHSERKSTNIRVEMTHPALGTIVGSTRDFSDGGASVKIDSHSILPEGTEVSVRFIKVVGVVNDQPALMTVVYRNKGQVGLKFSTKSC